MKLLKVALVIIALAVMLVSCQQPYEVTSPHWELVTKHAAFSPRDSAEGVVFNGEMWLTNGWEAAYEYPWDLWKTADGENWVKVMDEPPGVPYSRLVVFKGKMWSFGVDTWSSVNGVDWVLEETEMPCPLYRVVEFQDKLWTLGHSDGVWCTDNGINWQCVVEHAPFGERYTSDVVAYDNKLWLLGGMRGTYDLELGHEKGTVTSEVWCSDDGADWQLVANAPWPPRMWFRSIVFDGKIWVLSGFDGTGYVTNRGTTLDYDNNNFNDAWTTTDGVNWVEVECYPVWKQRHAPLSLVFDNALWVIGGKCRNVYNDVWKLV